MFLKFLGAAKKIDEMSRRTKKTWKFLGAPKKCQRRGTQKQRRKRIGAPNQIENFSMHRKIDKISRRNQKKFKKVWAHPLRWGGVFLERTRILSGIQFTTHLIEFFVVETKRFVGSTVNVILTRQTCGQRSSRAAESKRRALGNYFPERMCYMFLVSKCRGDWDQGLCT